MLQLSKCAVFIHQINSVHQKIENMQFRWRILKNLDIRLQLNSYEIYLQMTGRGWSNVYSRRREKKVSSWKMEMVEKHEEEREKPPQNSFLDMVSALFTFTFHIPGYWLTFCSLSLFSTFILHCLIPGYGASSSSQYFISFLFSISFHI